MESVITAVCVSEVKGVPKRNVGSARLVAGHGVEGDAHAGPWHRQVSLLAEESIDKMRAKGLDVGPGAFAENLTVRGLDLACLPVGTRLKVGAEALLEVTQVGKECHARCAIFHQVGDCVMPREGIFAKVLRGGVASVGDRIQVANTITVAVLTVSDKGSQGERVDMSGPAIDNAIASIGTVVERSIVPDEKDAISAELCRYVDELHVDLVFTTGGTGFAPRDVTPEATMAVVERLAPGIAEAMRARSLAVTPHAILSRAVAGIRGRTLIINLPGSPRACEECLEVILPALPHAIEILSGRGGECARG
ncbi:MAG: molybdopterin adenylyltransferase [Bacillota bacterium]|jgi:molybdopterin adenylyltransferase|nr:molybdopterin adenylyltransferase [Bacillota bacterium]